MAGWPGRADFTSLVFVLTSCRVMVNVIEGGGRAWCGAFPKAIFGRTCFCGLAAPRPARPWAISTGTGSTPNRCCRSAELSRDQLSQDRGGLSVASQYRFLELAASETNDSLLGLRLAVEMDLRVAGILFYLAASSATVAEALDHLVRYAATTNEDSPPRAVAAQWRDGPNEPPCARQLTSPAGSFPSSWR